MSDTCRKNKLSGYWKCSVTVSYQATTGTSTTWHYATSADCSPSMEGTLLDQRVFEALVQRCLPMIKDHFTAVDVQLSVASLPWFLSLYINSMPLIFAFRIVDCVLAMGVKVLFQIGLGKSCSHVNELTFSCTQDQWGAATGSHGRWDVYQSHARILCDHWRVRTPRPPGSPSPSHYEFPRTPRCRFQRIQRHFRRYDPERT
jgi:hypothetical protein